jgi:dihydrofolate synthase/folylpolyglutamate synthase
LKDSDIQKLFSRRNEYRSIRYDLANIRALCHVLGDPQRSFHSILIAGTNGKGAVARWISAMVPSAGLYLSPHLSRLNERISIGGVEIDDRELQVVHDDVQQAAKEAQSRLLYPPTYFELVTAMAFHFFRGRVSRAVIEVGLGGRLDATNILTQDVSVITSIGMDHQEYLGTTLDAIAAEKAGIIKDAEPVVIGKKCGYECVREKAGTRLIEAGGLQPRLRSLGSGLFEVDLETERRRYSNLKPRLAGRHQIDNLSVAICAAEALERIGWPIDAHTIKTAVDTAEWPGRLEVFEGTPPVIVDSGHNVDAMRAVARYLDEYYPQGVTLVFGAMADKDYRGMIDVLAPRVRHVIVTRSSSERAVDPEVLREILPDAVVTRSLEDAVGHARTHFADETVLVTGSVYLAGEALRTLRRTKEPA